MKNNPEAFRINIGFIVYKNVGYSREFEFNFQNIHFLDLDLENLTGYARFSKTSNGIVVNGDFKAETVLQCVRCLESYNQEVTAQFTELYAFTPDTIAESGLLVPESGIIDLTEIIRDEMILSIPISPLCSPNCKGLCPICGGNLNKVKCNHQVETIDPRLSVLKDLLKE
jgi:uncharacterized protein